MDVVSLIIHPYYASGVRKRAILWNWHKIWLAVEDPFIIGITPIYSNITQERSVQLVLSGARGDQSPRLIFHSPPASRDCVEFLSHSPGRKLRHNRALFISSSKVTFNSLLIKVWFFSEAVSVKRHENSSIEDHRSLMRHFNGMNWWKRNLLWTVSWA